MSDELNIIQKRYRLREFYDRHADDIERLGRNCLWQNPYYMPQKALELLNGACKSDGINIDVLAIFKLHDDAEQLIGFFPYNVQPKRWGINLPAYIMWWDELIKNNMPLIDKNHIDECIYYWAYFIQDTGGVSLIHLCDDDQFAAACDNVSVHIYADYNGSKTAYTTYLTYCNKTSYIRLRYAKTAEFLRLKIRDILR